MTGSPVQQRGISETYSRSAKGGVAVGPVPNPGFEWARYYQSQNWAIVPVPLRSKRPILKDWPNFRIGRESIQNHFDQPNKNIGVLLGPASGDLVDVDLDSPEAVRLADYFLPTTEAVFGRAGKLRSHRIYVCRDVVHKKYVDPDLQANQAAQAATASIVELRVGGPNKGIQTIFPPSVHESGELIEWATAVNPFEVAADDLRSAVAKLAAACLLLKWWRPGIRHDLTLAASGTLLRYGSSVDEVSYLIKTVCREAGDTEIDDRLRAVKDASTALAAKKRLFGIPKFVELTSQRTVDAFCEWLGIRVGKGSVSHTSTVDTSLRVICMRDVVATEVDWVWEPFIPRGEFTIMEGIEGIGKSWLICALATAIAAGNRLPFDERSHPQAPGRVLILSAEDSLEHTIRPRLDAMAADVGMIFAIPEVFSLSNDLDLIEFESILDAHKPDFVVFDPMFSYTSGKDLNAESASRPLARKLIALAQQYNCAIVGIRHIGKSKGQGDARSAGLGSISWRASARSVLLVGQDPETGERAICQTKNNLAAECSRSVGFDIEDGQFLFHSMPSLLTKERMLAQAKDPETKAEQTEAVELLREILRAGERPSKDVEKQVKEAGISAYMFRKAKTILGVKPFTKGGTYGGDPRWYLRLPGPAEVVDINAVRQLQQEMPSNSPKIEDAAEVVETLEERRLQHECVDNINRSEGKRPMAACECGKLWYAGHDCQNCGEPVP